MLGIETGNYTLHVFKNFIKYGSHRKNVVDSKISLHTFVNILIYYLLYYAYITFEHWDFYHFYVQTLEF